MIPSLMIIWWCYPTSRVFCIFLCLYSCRWIGISIVKGLFLMQFYNNWFLYTGGSSRLYNPTNGFPSVNPSMHVMVSKFKPYLCMIIFVCGPFYQVELLWPKHSNDISYKTRRIFDILNSPNQFLNFQCQDFPLCWCGNPLWTHTWPPWFVLGHSLSTTPSSSTQHLLLKFIRY